MGPDFNWHRWERVRETAERWWAGELRRPLIHVTRKDRDPGRPEPATPWFKYVASYDFSISPDDILDRWDYELSKLRFFGDAFPHAWPNFGAGVVAAFLGARLEPREETCWFLPPDREESVCMDFRFDPENTWYKRVAEVSRSAVRRWEGMVQVAMTDLGGNLDILSSFRPGEKLLFDLYDHPEDIKWLTWKAHVAWWDYFKALDTIIRPANQGYTAWTPILSEEPFYMLQCDFSYMIGPDMFDEFVKPELAASCKKLDHPFYHLDGPGQLVHLDAILSIPELKGVQWIPGAGSPGVRNWPEVYRKIRDAGKLIQLFGDLDDLDTVVDQLGSPEGVMLIAQETEASEHEIDDFLSKYNFKR